jgi:exodeoxyribonuclease V beta subunit
VKIDENGNIDIDLKQNILLEASAGTGKTYTLERVVLNLIRNPEYAMDLKEILVVTFTNKATMEMKDRIRKILVESYQREEDQGARERLSKALSDFDDASIFTIHGFCQNTLKAYPFESFSLFNQEIEKDNSIVLGCIWDYLRTLDRLPSDELLYFEAFRGNSNFGNVAENLLSLYMSNDLKNTFFYPDESLVLDIKRLKDSYSSNKGSLRETINKIKQYTSGDILSASKAMGCGTRETTFAKITDFFNSIDPSIDFEGFINALYNADKVIDALEKITSPFLEEKSKKGLLVNDIDQNHKDLILTFDGFIGELDWLFNKKGKNPLEVVYQTRFIRDSLGEIDKLVKAAQEDKGVLGYNDLIDNLYNRVMDNNNPQLLNSLKKRYKVALIDEFQDTDKKQWEIFKRIFGEDESHNFLLIGDPKQSIYGFRGADLEIYHLAKTMVKPENRHNLTRNFRSLEGIVKGCNIFFKGIFEADTGSFTSKNEFIAVDYDQSKPPHNIDNNPANIEFLFFDQESEEELKLDDCREGYFSLIEAKTFNLIDKNGVDPGDIAILVETHDDGENIKGRLQKRGIPVVVAKQANVFKSREAMDILSLLKAVNSPGRAGYAKTLLLTKSFNYPLGEIHEIEATGAIEDIFSMLFSWNQILNSTGIVHLWNQVEKGINNTSLEERILKTYNGERVYTNYRHIIEHLNALQRDRRLNSHGLLLALENLIANTTENEEFSVRLDRDSMAVQIMTIHASKGLEFPVVFFCGGFSQARKKSSDYIKYYSKKSGWTVDFLCSTESYNLSEYDSWEEKKRLYYVAFTRASQKLYLPLFNRAPVIGVTSLYASLDWEGVRAILGDVKMPIHSGANIPRDEELLVALNDKIYGDITGLTSTGFFSIDNKLYLEESAGYVRNKTLETKLYPNILNTSDGFSKRVTWTSSYSGLTRGATSSVKEDSDRADDVDTIDEQPQSGETLNVFNIPGSGIFGEMIHDFFENIDFSKHQLALEDYKKDIDVENQIEISSKRFFSKEWLMRHGDVIKELTWNTLNGRLPLGDGLVVGALTKENRIHEMEFLFRVDKSAHLEIHNLGLSFSKGYLKGFIDLVFNFNNKIYIADWKTTRIKGKENLENYNSKRVNESMMEHNYHLQGLIYSVALYLYLKKTKSDFNYQRDFGGYVYLYVRGMAKDMDSGVCYVKPTEKEILDFINGVQNE